MKTNLAFSLGKTFGNINKIMENIGNISLKEKRELISLFSNLLNDVKKSNSKSSIEIIEQKLREFSQTDNIEDSKRLGNEVYELCNELMENIYLKLKYNA